MYTKNLVMPNGLGNMSKIDLPISVLVESSNPQPALTEWVNEINFNPTKNLVNGIIVESGNCEIIEASHDSTSSVELWSGSERSQHRSGPIIP